MGERSMMFSDRLTTVIVSVLVVGFGGWLTYMANGVSTNNKLLVDLNNRLISVETRLSLLRIPPQEVSDSLKRNINDIKDHEIRIRHLEEGPEDMGP